MFGELEARLPGLEHGLVGLADLFPERMLLPDQLLRGVAVALDPTFKASDEVPDRLTLLENLEQKKNKLKFCFVLFNKIEVRGLHSTGGVHLASHTAAPGMILGDPNFSLDIAEIY